MATTGYGSALVGATLNPIQSDAANQVERQGIVVESVVENFEAQKAGLREGDVLLYWTRGDVKGDFQSPFDLAVVEIEQAPRGAVTLAGMRGTETAKWTMGPTEWGIQARPALSDPGLTTYTEGKKLASSGDRARAEERWRDLARERPALQTWLRFRMASWKAEARLWKESDADYQAAIESAAAGPGVQAQLLRGWARTYVQRNDWANAEDYYRRSIAESKKQSAENLFIAVILNDLGILFGQRGDLAKAEEYYRQSLEMRQRLAPGSLDVATSFNNLGSVVGRRGDLVKEEEYQRQALEIRQRVAPGSLDVARSLHNLALVYSKTADLTKAEDYYRQALEIKQRLVPGSLDAARSIGNLGLLEQQRGDLAKAEDYLRQATEIFQKKVPGSMDVARGFNNIAEVAITRGDLVKAGEYLDQALEIEEKLAPGSLSVAYSLGNRGLIEEQRGDWAKAEGYFRQTLEIFRQKAPESLDAATVLENLGLIEQRRGNLAKAEEYYQQTLEIRQKLAPGGLDIAFSFQNLGFLAKDRKELGKAAEYFRRASEIQSRFTPESKDHAETLAALAGVVRRSGEPDSAAHLYEQALNAFEGQTARLGGRDEVRAGFRAAHGQYYSEYVDLLVSQNNAEAALQVWERSRAQMLLETLAAGHVDIHTGADPRLLEKERAFHADLRAKSDRRIQLLTAKASEEPIKAVEKEISGLTAAYQEVEAQIRTSSPVYAALTQPRPATLAEIQQDLLDRDTLLLEYCLGEPSYLFAVTQDSIHTYTLADRAAIEEQAKRLHDLITARNSGAQGETEQGRAMRVNRADKEWAPVAAALSRMLLEPAAAHLNHKRFLIVAGGMLLYVPFGALPAPDSLVGGKQTPLIVSHEIVNLPSASTLAALRREALARPPASKELALLADPVFDRADERVDQSAARNASPETLHPSQDAAPAEASRWLTRSEADLGLVKEGHPYLPRLWFTRREAEDIWSTVPAERSRKALDFAARRDLAMSSELAGYRVVHFATHALVDDRHPELSGLVFSLVDQKGNSQDGFMDLQDIYNLSLRADLVVLSACETALGKQVEGEGMVGLGRAFMYAGASRVLASLWKVNDLATAKLMKTFYESMEREGASPARALRKAQLELSKEKRWSAPYFWAGFVLQGEWK